MSKMSSRNFLFIVLIILSIDLIYITLADVEGECNSVKQFHCGNGKCIRREYVCDQDTDCTNGLDEMYCHDCARQEFYCRNRGCISVELLCDGSNDCSNNLDERHCKDANRVVYLPDHDMTFDRRIECVHGQMSGEYCDCLPNFGGKYCNETCAPNTFGTKCEHNCSCLIDPKCNANYTSCSCSSLESASNLECTQICKCRANSCDSGFVGRNCSVPCPDYTFGKFCAEKCTCVKNNTIECHKESGDCRCKEKFHGLQCENECTGFLECNTNTINCTCKATIEQEFEKTKSDLVRLNKMTKEDIENRLEKSKNYLEQRFNYTAAVILLMMIALFVLFLMFYKMKNRKIKNDLKMVKCSIERGELNKKTYDCTFLDSKNSSNFTDSDRLSLLAKFYNRQSIQQV